MPDAPFQLKNIYSPEFVTQIAGEFAAVQPDFDKNSFLNAVFDAQWHERELKQRIRHISHCLLTCLPHPYADALSGVLAVTRRLLDQHGDQQHFGWMILPDFVEAFGVDQPDVSIPALELITQYVSAEFAVRPFLLRYPERMYAQMLAWATHENAWVRRLSSEGFRPRLPWGAGIPVLKKDPSPILPVLELLKQDTAETVRRSVANNLNDISKDHPELVLQLAQRWQGLSPQTNWIVKHACRGLLKKAHPQALALHGFETGQNACTATDLRCDARVRIGDRLSFSFTVENTGQAPEALRLEYAIHYQTRSGKISRKVFKLKEFTLPAGERVFFEKQQRFQDFTTRKHFPGEHRLDILLNGTVATGTGFMVETLHVSGI